MTTSGSMAAGSGLEGVSLGPTEIALVDGENGRLIYRGHDAEQLAQDVSFEEVAFLLWEGRLPEGEELTELRRGLAESMEVPGPVRDVLARLTEALPMDALRSALSTWAALRHKEEGGFFMLDILRAIRDMPETLRKLALVYLFQWYALFIYWQFVSVSIAKSVYDAAPGEEGFDKAVG